MKKNFAQDIKDFLKKFFLELGNIGLIQNGFLIFIRVSTIPRIATGWDMQIYSRVRLQMVIVEVKATDNLIGEHKAQVINYLAASKLPLGLIINFDQFKAQTARLQHPFNKAERLLIKDILLKSSS